MKVVVPVMTASACAHLDDRVKIYSDEYGVTKIVCDVDGEWNKIEMLEFDDEEAYKDLP